MNDDSVKRIFEAKITSKGQMVIPKPLRERYNLKQGSRVKLVITSDGILIKSSLEGPWIDLRGMMTNDWKDRDLDQHIEEAKKSLYGG